MKKILITTLLAAATAASSFAQGDIGFQNASASAVTVVSSGGTNKMFGSAGTYDFGLYLGSAGTTSIQGMQLVDLVASPNAPLATSFNAGLFAAPGGSITSPGNVANTIDFLLGPSMRSSLLAGRLPVVRIIRRFPLLLYKASLLWVSSPLSRHLRRFQTCSALLLAKLAGLR